MKKVLFLPEVVEQFLELAEILYNKGYMSFKDSAVEYSENLFRDIENTLHLKAKMKAPAYFQRYGKGLLYSSFAKNKHTVWYVFYSVYDMDGITIYLVRYLGNNHVVSQNMIDG